MTSTRTRRRTRSRSSPTASAIWTNLESTDDPEEESYSFDGSSGSLDHVIANAAADAMVTGVDIWEINGNETVFNQYSRYNYVGTDLYNNGPFSASDHNPEVVGINVTPPEPATRQIQIIGTNDFHGRIQNDTTSASAGAAVMAGAVKQLRAANPDTAFVAAGDLIGASTFESFIQKDKPTIDALNEAGLDVSAAGNHEFDQGYNDLVNRVMAPYDVDTNPYGGAEWEYIAANMRNNGDDTHALAPTWTQDFGSVKVGYVGAVTEHLPELVSPGGISTIHVTDIVTEVNAAAGRPEGRRRRRDRHAGARGRSQHQLREHRCARPGDGLRVDRPGSERQHRRDRVGPHPPRLQLLVRGAGLGGS